MPFEWDEKKREANLEKHGIDFVRAAKIFRNPVIERTDDRVDYGEKRWIALGHWHDDYIVTIYTWRDEIRRIISAWKAGRDEQEEYHACVSGRTGRDDGQNPA